MPKFSIQKFMLNLFSFFFILLPNSFEKLVRIPDKFKLWHWLEEFFLLKNSKPESSNCGSRQIFGKAEITYSLNHKWDGWCLGVDDQVRYRSTQNHLTDPYILQYIQQYIQPTNTNK